MVVQVNGGRANIQVVADLHGSRNARRCAPQFSMQGDSLPICMSSAGLNHCLPILSDPHVGPVSSNGQVIQ